MPSLTVFASLLATVSAAAVCRRPTTSASTSTAAVTAASSVAAATPSSVVYTLPVAGGSHELAAPPADAKLLTIAIGHGLQNYTCAGPDATPVATGALAVLYDVTPFFATLERSVFDSIPRTTLYDSDLPLNFIKAGMASASATPVDYTDYDTVPGSPFSASTPDLKLASGGSAPVIGHHYFDAAGVPTFDLFTEGLLGSMSKTDSAVPVYEADAGPMGTGAVPWLLLGQNANGLSRGITYIYRVVTDGGAAVSCSLIGNGTSNVPYTTQYWFYA